MDLTRSDHPFINDLEIGDIFDGYFVLRTVQLGTTRANKPFLIFDFTDRSGHIKGKMWEDAELAYRALEEGIIVKVRAIAEEYQGQAELKILRIRPADDDAGDMSRFLPSADHEPEEDWAIIRNAVANVEHPGLSELLKSLLEDEEFVAVFERAPAGKRWHHGYLGGLLEHTASMVKIAGRLSDHYDILDRDLLIAGAMFHDIGKLEELRFDTTIDYTVKGRLLGHIVLGVDFIRKRAEGIEELDEETLTHLLHLVLSHQGKLENSTPVEPKSREAFILYYIDEIDSKMNAIGREIDKASGGGGQFTDYIRLLGTMLYKGRGDHKDDQQQS